MKKLTILNMRHASTWAKYENAPAALVPQEHSRTPCDKCPAHCCHHTCHVSAYEVARIALTLSLEVERFCAPQPYAEVPKERGVAVYHGILLDDGLAQLHFLQRGEGIAPCTFLIDHYGAGRCSIYDLRPGVCRQYPFAVRDDEGEVSVGDTEVCRPSWLYDEDTEAEVAASLARWRADLEADRALVERWNQEEREARSFADFARWLVEECQEELGGDAKRVYIPQRRRLGRR